MGAAAKAEEGTTARQVAVDWNGLEAALARRHDDSQTYLDLRCGDVVYLTAGWSDDHGFSEEELAEGLASGRLAPIEPLAAETERGWMNAFAEALEDGWARDALFDALTLPRSAEGFLAALGRFPRERQAWLACRRGRLRAVVRAWLEAADVEPTNEDEAVRR